MDGQMKTFNAKDAMAIAKERKVKTDFSAYLCECLCALCVK